MTDRTGRALLLGRLLCLATWMTSAAPAAAATYRTPNFVITAQSAAFAKECGRACEHYRRELAIEWTGRAMPNWKRPCPVSVKVGNIGAGGATTFSFDRGEVFGWKMNVQGTEERILDSVLPHEVSHTVFACYFRRPLPRWADEGAATLVEHSSERNRQTRLLNQVIRTSRRIPLRSLLKMTEYPKRMEDVLTLYAEGYSLADLLVQEKGKATYLKFLEDAHRRGWTTAIRRHYGYGSVEELERRWNGWVLAGSPAIESNADELLADASGRALQNARGQSPRFQPTRTTPERSGISTHVNTPDAGRVSMGTPSAEPVSFGEPVRIASADSLTAPSPQLRDRSALVRPIHREHTSTARAALRYAKRDDE